MAIVDIIAGARPNFVKIAPILSAMQKRWQKSRHEYRLIHTGQHYDKSLSDIFFEQLGIPEPYINLRVGSGTQSEQTSEIMLRYEKFLANSPCDFCLVVGDVNSTMASAIVAKKSSAIVGHVEAGIRSGDLNMPEEINRIVTDSISDYFFTTSINASNNLLRNGVKKSQIFFVGNTMIDTLFNQEKNFRRPKLWEEYKLSRKKYLLMTLHRPSNVDDPLKLQKIIDLIAASCVDFTVVFSAHPRVEATLRKICRSTPNIKIVPSLPYLEFCFLCKNALGVVTDSGGLSEETTVFGVPCITLRDTTERPETINLGSNELVGQNLQRLTLLLQRLFKGEWKKSSIPELWDGNAGYRVVAVLDKLL